MKANNPFDQKLDTWGHRVPEDVREASTFVTDTMTLCWAAAQTVFEGKASPDVAIAIYDRVVQRIALRQQRGEPPE
jgi:hypothetical protein